MKIRKIIIGLLLSTPLLFSSVSALENDGFHLDINHKGSITIDYKYKGESLEDVDFDVYRIANVNEDGKFYVVDKFKHFDIDFDNIKELNAWLPLKFNLQNYINLNMIEKEENFITTHEDTYILSGLRVGLYYVEPRIVDDGETDFFADPMLVMIGQANDTEEEHDLYVYHFKIVPKVGGETHDPNPSISVSKKWENMTGAQKPSQIEVELYKDGTLHDTVVLNSENNWRHEWEYMDPDARWAVKEKGQLKDFEVNYKKSHYDFTITNTYVGKKTELPDTGISYTNVALVSAAGVLFILLGVTFRER